eukprot:6440309-Amphidinium_carterae.1
MAHHVAAFPDGAALHTHAGTTSFCSNTKCMELFWFAAFSAAHHNSGPVRAWQGAYLGMNSRKEQRSLYNSITKVSPQIVIPLEQQS